MTQNSSERSERTPVVAVVSSPSTNTSLMLDIIDDRSHDRLVGAMVGFTSRQLEPGEFEESTPFTAVLGQITSLEMRNRWHEDQTFKNIIKSQQSLPAITQQQDTRTAVMKIGGCFIRNEGREGYSHGDLGSVPSTGTEVNLVRQSFLDRVLSFCKDELFYLGNAYGNNIGFPMWFKHFGAGEYGTGEAYHLGIFGKTGSGKTGLAKMLLLAYARHPDMGILVIDPQGEFSLEMRGNQVGRQQLNTGEILRFKLRRKVVQLPISKIRLTDWDLFRELLVESRFFSIVLGIRTGDPKFAAETLLMRHLERRYSIHQLESKECAHDALTHLKSNAHDVYKTSASVSSLKERLEELNNAGFERFFGEHWLPIAHLFARGEDKQDLEHIVAEMIGGNSRQSKPIIVLDLSTQSGATEWSETLQKRVTSYIANALITESSKTLGSDSTANTLVILDEAHRFVPSGDLWNMNDQERMLLNELKRAVRETRKYGVGWMFISQTMQGIDAEILMQLRAMFFGYGLAMGLEFTRLRELAGGDDEAMNLYRSFRDPQSAVDAESKHFPFMVIGPISPMPFSGQPMFISALGTEDFLRANASALKTHRSI